MMFSVIEMLTYGFLIRSVVCITDFDREMCRKDPKKCFAALKLRSNQTKQLESSSHTHKIVAGSTESPTIPSFLPMPIPPNFYPPNHNLPPNFDPTRERFFNEENSPQYPPRNAINYATPKQYACYWCDIYTWPPRPAVGTPKPATITTTQQPATTTKKPQPKNCQEAFNGTEGAYMIKPPSHKAVKVYCMADRQNAARPWMLVLRRNRGSENFNRHHNEYRAGFGDAHRDHWLGLEVLYLLTNSQRYELLIRVDGEMGEMTARYNRFAIGHEDEGYILSTLGVQTEKLYFDSLRMHMGSRFSTKDKSFSRNDCARKLKAGWWFFEQTYMPNHDCADIYLTAKYDQNNELPQYAFHTYFERGYKVERAIMAIRPYAN